MESLVHDEQREKELQELCEKVIKSSSNRWYNPNGKDESTCPFCSETTYGIVYDVRDLKHSASCGYLIAKGLITNLKPDSQLK